MHAPAEPAPNARALQLGYAGLLPFVLLAAAIWVAPQAWQTVCALTLAAYAATVASFLGAIHWGLVMRDPDAATQGQLVWGVAPSLLAWVALLLDPVSGLSLLGCLIGACYAFDRRSYPGLGVARWLPLRLRLTVVAGVCCFASAAGLVLR